MKRSGDVQWTWQPYQSGHHSVPENLSIPFVHSSTLAPFLLSPFLFPLSRGLPCALTLLHVFQSSSLANAHTNRLLPLSSYRPASANPVRPLVQPRSLTHTHTLFLPPPNPRTVLLVLPLHGPLPRSRLSPVLSLSTLVPLPGPSSRPPAPARYLRRPSSASQHSPDPCCRPPVASLYD
mmetsp:Transcript_25160/g.43438  ORF Transcript_25160/g.43438 Transcript_25160/m.43438 type:complete len:179 (+) Transcript_25160:36-572(+)